MLDKTFVGEVVEYIDPTTDNAIARKKDLEEIQNSDASLFMKKSGAKFVSEQYGDIKNTNARIDLLEKMMMEKASKNDATMDTITEVYRQLTKKNDNNAKNVLRLYQGNNNDSSPLLKKEAGGESGVTKIAGEASTETLQIMSALTGTVQAMASTIRENNEKAKLKDIP